MRGEPQVASFRVAGVEKEVVEPNRRQSRVVYRDGLSVYFKYQLASVRESEDEFERLSACGASFID